MTVSSLASKTVPALSSNYTSGRAGNTICKITPHHVAGVRTGEACAQLFQVSGKDASANYCIGYDGDIVCSVEEENRSWCSSNGDNDRKAITIECSNSSTGGDYPISDATWNSLVKLCVDICTRYGFRLEYTGDSTGSLTEHRMFASTICPGEYLHSRMEQLVSEVNAILEGEDMPTTDEIAKAVWDYNINCDDGYNNTTGSFMRLLRDNTNTCYEDATSTYDPTGRGVEQTNHDHIKWIAAKQATQGELLEKIAAKLGIE